MNRVDTDSPRNDSRAGRFNLQRAVAGVGYAAALSIGGLAIYEGAVNATNDRVAIEVDSAKPSDATAKLFDDIVYLGAAAGLGSLIGRGYSHLRTSMDYEGQAVYNLAHARHPIEWRGYEFTIPRAIASVSLLPTVMAGSLGMYKDMSDGIAHAQSNVSHVMTDVMNLADHSDKPTWVLTNSPRPEIANSAVVNPTAATDIMTTAAREGITVVPVHYEWHSAEREGEKGTKIQVLTVGLPEALIGLPPKAGADCTNVPAVVAKPLAIENDDKTIKPFTMEGLTMQVANVLPQNDDGPNLVPVVVGQEAFKNCIDTNPDQPPSALLARGDKAQIDKLLADAGVSLDKPTTRIYPVPEETFVESTLQTGKNSVNPFVLVASLVGMAGLGIAIANKAGRKLANVRDINTMLHVRGWSSAMFRQLYGEKAHAESIQSSIASLPIIAGIDYSTNMSTPGAGLGPNIVTGLFAIGGTSLVNQLSTRLALNRELNKIKKSQG